MSQFGERAQALHEHQDSLRAELHAVLADAGSHLLEKPAQSPGTDLAQIREREREVTEQVRAVEAARARIGEIQDRLLAAKEQGSEIQSEIRRLSENMDPIYEEIGRLAFEVYRGNPLVDQEYADIFSALVEVNSELSGIEAAIGDQEALLEAKPFLEKMVIRGRIALLKNRRVTREGSFRRLVRSAGRDIMGTAFVDEIGDPKLTAAAEPYRDRLKTARERESDFDAVNEERHALNEELEKLGATKRPHKKREELESDLLTLTQTRNAIRVELASAVRQVPKDELPTKCRSLFGKAAKIEQRLDELAVLSDRVQAALDVEQLEHDVEQLTAEIKRKEAHQTKLKKESATLKREKKEADLRLEEKQQDRGPAEEILAPDLLNNL